MAVTLTNISNLLTNNYRRVMREQMRSRVIFYDIVNRTVEPFQAGGSATAYIKTMLSDTQGLGAVTYTDDFPTSGNAVYGQLAIPLTYIYGTVSIYYTVMKLANRDPMRFAKELDIEMSSLMRRLRKDLNAFMYGSGLGTLATLSANVTADTDVTVTTTQNLEAGMLVDIVSTAGTEKATDATISSVDDATGITLAANATAVSGDIIVRADSYNKAPVGLETLIDTDNTLFGYDRTDYYILQANVNDNGGSAADLDLKNLIDVYNTCLRRGESDVTHMLAQEGIVAAYSWLMSADRRYLAQEGLADLDAGWQGATFFKIPFIADPNATAQTIYLIDAKSLVRTPLCNLEWVPVEGGGNRVIRLDPNNKALYVANLVHADNLAADRFNGLGKMTNVLDIANGTYS